MFFNDNLKWWQVDFLHRAKLSLSMLYCIEQFLTGHKIEGKDSKELEKRGYIKNGELTQIAKDIYEAVANMEEPLPTVKSIKKNKLGIVSSYDEQWKEFYEEWPKRNGFIWKGTEFEDTRSMRDSEDKCKLLYLKAITKGYTSQQLLHAKRAMFTAKMEESYRTGKNQVQYLNGLRPWLNQEVFCNWIDASVVEEKIVRPLSTDIDI